MNTKKASVFTHIIVIILVVDVFSQVSLSTNELINKDEYLNNMDGTP